MAPVVDGLIADYEDTVAIRKYNVEASDKAADLADEYGVYAVPTFVFVDGEGEVVDTILGEVPEKTLRGALDDLAAE